MKKIFTSLTSLEKIIILLLVYIALLSLVGMYSKWQQSHISLVTTSGGRFREGMMGRIRNFNPYLPHSSTAEKEAASLIFSGLSKYDPLTKQYIPDLAKSTSLSKDKKTITVTLDTTRLWHDGVHFSADDVLFSYQTLPHYSKYFGPYKESFKGITIQKLDAETLIFNVKEPNNYILELLTAPIMPKHLFPRQQDLESFSFSNSSFNSHPIGTGKYKFRKYTTSKYKDTVLLQISKPSSPQELELIAYHDFKYLLKDAPKLSAVSGLSPSQHELLRDTHLFNFHSIKLPRAISLFFDTEGSSPVSNPLVRLGIKYALNKKQITASAKDAVMFNFPVKELDSQIISQDLSKAATTLYKAGWSIYSSEFNDNLRRDKDKKVMHLSLLVPIREELVNAATLIKEQLKPLGILVDVQPLPLPEIFSKYLKQRKFDMILLGQELSNPEDLFSFLHSSQTKSPGLNFSQYQNISADILLENIRQTSNYPTRLHLLRQLKKTINQDVPIIFLYHPYFIYATNRSLSHITLPSEMNDATDRFSLLPNWNIHLKTIWQLH